MLPLQYLITQGYTVRNGIVYKASRAPLRPFEIYAVTHVLKTGFVFSSGKPIDDENAKLISKLGPP